MPDGSADPGVQHLKNLQLIRYECSCLITAIKYVLDHVAHRHDDQLPLVSVPDATTATQLGSEAQGTTMYSSHVALLIITYNSRPLCRSA